jgi:hypothetical protein
LVQSWQDKETDVDYESLLKRAWTVVWGHKVLIILGVLAGLGGGGSGSGFSLQGGEGDWNWGQGPQAEGALGGFPIILAIFLIGLLIIIVIAIWILATLARGGLVAGVDEIERTGATTFASAWNGAWQRAGSLIGIALLPAIPVLLLVVAALFMTGIWAGMSQLFQPGAGFPLRGGLVAGLVGLACLAVPVALVLSLLHTFAERACLLENLGVIDSYRRGSQVLMQNLGPAILLFLIQMVIGIVLALVLLGPGLVAVICCVLWPVLLVINGAITAYFSTVWTLAWRTWTGAGPTGAVTTDVAAPV